MPVALDPNGQLPTLTVEVDKTNQPTNPTRVWTEITSYVRLLTATRSGRNDEFQRTTPGTLNILLNNRDDSQVRLETLGIAKAQWVRVSATWQGTTTRLWMGVIEELLRQWPQSGKDATIQLTATDAFKLTRLYDLAGLTFPAQRVDQRMLSILAAVGFTPGYANTVLAFGPSLYWRMGEPSGTLVTDSSGNGRTGTYGSGITLAQAGAPISDTDTAALFNHTANATATSTYTPYVAGSKRTFMGWAKLNSEAIQVMFTGTGGTGGWALQIGSTNPTDVFFLNFTGSCGWRLAWPAFGSYVHWALTYDDSTGNAELFLNGVSQGVQNTGTSGSGTNSFVVGTSVASFLDGTIDEIAVFEYVLSAKAIAAIYAARQVAPAASMVTVDTDSDTCDAVTTPLSTGSDALSQLLALEGSDNGLLIANGDGTFTFQGRHWRVVNALTSSGTFSDDGGNANIPYRDTVQHQDDDTRIANVVNVTPLGASTPVTVNDTASQAKYFARSNQSVDRSLLSSSTALALSAAQYLLGKYKDPTPRIPTLEIQLLGLRRFGTTFITKLLAAANSQRFTFKRTTAAPISADFYVEQVTHMIDPTVPSWLVRLACTPADVETYWVLGDSTLGVLGSTTKLAY